MSTATPVRYPQGVSNSFKGELLADLGSVNPFQNHVWDDDFDWLGATGVKYTFTNPNSGTIALTPGDGGRILFTTGATSGNPASIQLPAASFPLTLGRRTWFAARLQLAALSVPSWVAGLMQTSATVGTVADGIVFEKPTGAETIFLRHYVGSVATLSLQLPTNFLPLAGADFDIGFYLNGKGLLTAFGSTVANKGLFGYSAENYSTIYRSSLKSGVIPTLTAVNLNPTLGVITNAASAATMTADFMLAAKERS